MTLLRQIESQVAALSRSEAKVARVILAYGNAAARFSIARLAQEADASVSAVQRLCRTLGYDGYKDFRYELRMQADDGRAATRGDDLIETLARDMACSIGALASLERIRLDGLARSVASAPLVVCTGVHYSGVPARMLRMRLEDLGVMAVSACDVAEARHLSRIVGADARVVHFSVAGSRVPLGAGSGEGFDMPVETWLVTSGPRHVSGLPDDHVVALPNVLGGGDHAVMVAFVELLVSLVGGAL